MIDGFLQAFSTVATKCPFLRPILYTLEIIETEKIPVAAINKYGQLFINPKRWNQLPQPVKNWILLHELFHILFGQFKRFETAQSPFLANIAMDAEVNADIRRTMQSSDVQLTDGIQLIFPETVGCEDTATAEEIYTRLLQQAQNMESEQSERFQRNAKSDESQSSGAGKQKNQDESSGDLYEQPGKIPEGKVDESQGQSNNQLPEGQIDVHGYTEEEHPPVNNEKEIEYKRTKSLELAEEARQQGKAPLGVIREIEKARCKVPWHVLLEVQLKKAVYGQCKMFGIKKFHPAFKDVSVPTLNRAARPVVVVIADTSGSISDKELGRVRYIIEKLMTVASIWKVDCDAAAYDLVEVRNIRNLTFKGGGGTDFRPAFDLITKTSTQLKPSVVLLITDTEGTFPEKPPSYPVKILTHYYLSKGMPEWARKQTIVINGGEDG